jgi:hypothetical protein
MRCDAKRRDASGCSGSCAGAHAGTAARRRSGVALTLAVRGEGEGAGGGRVVEVEVRVRGVAHVGCPLMILTLSSSGSDLPGTERVRWERVR